ncbi:Glutathione import ATP-binding protein GsiA [Austwickia sp. TVS 96-490-7B]|uniref:dipeptide ABC transporter ATP-binding protein n=1 Tax=Austwickia sp. TVS 96-490-7B TaxID=2830843 RepID=UPI001C58D1D6|nr:ABC transporter ATP-binding protein [Austwickia sp. TVS 96-490-7B]MBW3086455.1 Glutathione import ATP-binding protein GsiA [Austwickia sp. TVS 96-490-7B]
MTHPAPKPLLTVRGLTITHRDTVLVDSINLSIARGERVGLIGESGSGKTLTALAVMGLLPESLRATGTVELQGEGGDLLARTERELAPLRGRRLGMVFQEPMTALNPTMRVGRQVAEALRIHGDASRGGRDEVVALLREVRLPDPEQAVRAYPHQLSGGQRQRVVLAMALAHSPDLLICDEPTTALDVTVQANVLDLIVAGVQERHTGLLFISHDLAVVATTCERVIVMRDGKIVESGEVGQVLTSPQHEYTQALVAASDLRDVDERGRLRVLRPGDVAVAPPVTASVSSVSADRDTLPAPLPGPGDEASPYVEISGLTRVYRRPRTAWRGPAPQVVALRDVDLTMRRGERWGIVGESGCGKSTLLRLLAGLDRPTAGTVHVDGQLVSGRPESGLGFLRRQLQMVFQDPRGSFDPRRTVQSSLREPLVAVGSADHHARIVEVLSAVGIDPVSAQRYPHQFSGGQRQRLSIARAIGPRPQILLADEPVSALDVSVRAQVLNVLADLVEEMGLTMVFVSHDLSVVRHVCERVAVMKAGQVVEVGTTEEIFTAPQQPYTRRLLASVPTVERALAGVSAADLAAAREQEHPGGEG